MAKNIILETRPPKPKELKQKKFTQESFLTKFLGKETTGFLRSHNKDEKGRFFRSFPIKEFKKGDLILIPKGALLEYGDFYLDEFNHVYTMTALIGQGAGSVRQYFRQSANMTNVSGYGAAFEYYLG